jgi:N-formylglutamate amidohydrolase
MRGQPSSTSSIRPAPFVGATLIAARFPRAYIDPNRSILDIDTTPPRGRLAGSGDPQPQDRARHRASSGASSIRATTSTAASSPSTK